jgi:hypothetical protein
MMQSQCLSQKNKVKVIQRYLVTEVVESEYEDDNGRQGLEKVSWGYGDCSKDVDAQLIAPRGEGCCGSVAPISISLKPCPLQPSWLTLRHLLYPLCT